MLKKQISVGGIYRAMVSGVLCDVRVDKIRKDNRVGGGARRRGQLSEGTYTVYDVTNLRTGRALVFNSAMKFRNEVPARGSEAYKQLPFMVERGHCAICEKRKPLCKRCGRCGSCGCHPTCPVPQPQPAPISEEAKVPAPFSLPATTSGASASNASESDSATPVGGSEVEVTVSCEDCGGEGCEQCGGLGYFVETSTTLPTTAVEPCEKVQATSPLPMPSEAAGEPACTSLTPSDVVPGLAYQRAVDQLLSEKPVKLVSGVLEGIPARSDIAREAKEAGVPLRSLLSASSSRLNDIFSKIPGHKSVDPVPQVADIASGLTAEQLAILELGKELEAVRRDQQRVMVIGAGAGTGKTYTLKKLEEVLDGNGQYTAFNASLVAESKAKFTRAACNTTHSLAFREVGKRFAHRLKSNRVKSYQIAAMLGIEDYYVTVQDATGSPESKRLLAKWLASKVMAAIRKFCQSADPALTVKHFPYIDGVDSTEDGKRSYANNDEIKAYLLPFAEKAWEDLSSVTGAMPFAHDVYVKLWQLGRGPNRPIIAADYILLDEAQDTAPVMLDVLKRQEHALLILVGDDNQQIYEWRGAVNAMSAFKGSPRRLLSQSFRFGQAVADVANSVLAGLEEKTDLVMKGLGSIPSRICSVAEPRCYLYRTNAGAVGRLMRASAEGKKAHLIGGSKEVVEFCKAAVDIQAGKGTSHPELGSFSKWPDVVAYAAEDEGEDLRLMVKLIEEFKAEKIHAALENMPSEDKADLVLSTAHRSKGREWSSVKLGPDFPTANKLTDSDRRLIYVACTRAQEELDLTACPTFCGGYDRQARGGEDEGKLIPGIKINYTTEMPSEEQLAEYRRGRGMVRVAEAAAEVLAPVTSPPNGEPNVVEDFTWANVDGEWRVRGPGGFTSKRVTVSRKNGTKSEETLRDVVKQTGALSFYAIAKSGR